MGTFKGVVPIMTSNSQDGFTLSSSSATSTVYSGVDGDIATYFRSAVSPSLPEYFTVNFPQPINISRYKLYLGNWNAQYANMATWDFQGLINGNWTTLHSGSNTQVANTLTFDFTTVKVEGVRIKCNTRYGSNSWGFDELTVYELVPFNKILISCNGEYNKYDSSAWKPIFRLNSTSGQYERWSDGSPAVPESNAVPKMTSNTSPSGVASASLEMSGREAWKAFDSDNTTEFSTGSGTSGWLAYEFSSSIKLVGYSIFPYSTTNSPKDFDLEAYNESTASWDMLDSKRGVTYTSATDKKTYTFSTSNSYKKYRLNILNTGGSYIRLNSLELIGEAKPEVSPSWIVTSDTSPTESDYINNGMDDISTIPESAWSELTGDVGLHFYTDDSAKSEVEFEVETDPFTLSSVLGDNPKIVYYTDDMSASRPTAVLETEPYTFYDEHGDSMEILYYTDDTAKTSASVDITANYSPLDEINEDFDLVVWTNDTPSDVDTTLTPVYEEASTGGDLYKTTVDLTLGEGVKSIK